MDYFDKKVCYGMHAWIAVGKSAEEIFCAGPALPPQPLSTQAAMSCCGC